MRTLSIAAAIAVAAFAAPASANPALHGTWSATVDGQPLVVTFEANGTGKVNDAPMRWQALGKLLFVQQQGGQPVGYSFEAKGDKLSVAGGDLNATVTLSRGTAAAKVSKPGPSATASSGQELVGKWCKMTTFSANAGGGSQRSTCFELRADGTYAYHHEGSMSAYSPGIYGGSASQSSDAGRWKVSGNKLTAHSQRGSVNTYTIEKRNHPKNKRDPMLCLDGECYVTFYNRAPW